MRNYKYLLLVSTCLLFNNNSQALELDLTFNSTPSSFGIHTPYTHTPVELKPILISDTGVKLAAVCALGSGGCDGLGFGNSDNDIDLDNNEQCRDEGFVNSCSSGYCMDESCPYTNNYGKCVAENCPSNSSPTCTGAVSGKNACGNNCYQCCSDACPGSSSKSYSGTLAGKTACGNQCYNCSNSCPSGSLSYSGSYAGTNECGNSCYNCSNSCPSGYSSTNPGGCYDTASTQCGNTCYKSKSCCSDTCERYFPPSRGSYTSYTNDCSNTCYTKPSCSDDCGGTMWSFCPSGRICTTCYNGCDGPASLKLEDYCSPGQGYRCGTIDGCADCHPADYPYLSCPENAICSSHVALLCGSCGTGYKVSGCVAGYTLSGGNCVTACTPINCSGYDLGSCPTNGTCSTCTVGCGDNSAKYKLTGCQAGYALKDGSCVEDICPTGFSLGAGCDCIKGAKLDFTPGGMPCYKCCTGVVNQLGCFKCNPEPEPNLCLPDEKAWCYANGYGYINCSLGQSTIPCPCNGSYSKCS